MKKVILLIILIICFAFLYSGCDISSIRTINLGDYTNGDQMDKEYVYYTSQPEASVSTNDEVYYLVGMHIVLPYWQDHKRGLKVAAEELGVRYVFTGESGNDAVRQVDIFRQVMVQKPAGILVSPIDPEIMVGPINDAIAEGIPVICVDTDSPKSNRYTYFGTGNYNAGYEGARILARSMNYTGDVGILTSPGILCLDERERGFDDYVKYNCPGIKIVKTENDTADPSKAINVATQMNLRYRAYSEWTPRAASGWR
jgi:ABC-type sugar transport system substrate-binding protein